MYATVHFLTDFADDANIKGEYGYCIATLETALGFIMTLQPEEIAKFVNTQSSKQEEQGSSSEEKVTVSTGGKEQILNNVLNIIDDELLHEIGTTGITDEELDYL